MRLTILMFLESEVWVDEFGVAHDDEGNTWKVGRMAPGLYRPRDVPSPGGGYDKYWADKLWEPKKSMGKALNKLVYPRPKNLADKDWNFIVSVREQMMKRAHKYPTEKQAAIIGRILKRLGWSAEAALFVPEKEKKEKSAAGSQERSDVIKVLDAALERRPNSFLSSIRDQLLRGKSLTDKQKKAVRRNLYQLGMRDEASVFKESEMAVVSFGIDEREQTAAQKAAWAAAQEKGREAQRKGGGFGGRTKEFKLRRLRGQHKAAMKKGGMLGGQDVRKGDPEARKKASALFPKVLKAKKEVEREGGETRIRRGRKRWKAHHKRKMKPTKGGKQRVQIGDWAPATAALLREQSAITTGGIHSTDTRAAHYPHPFMFPILMKPSTVPPGEVKAREACLKAMRAYSQGSIGKKELDRICSGFKE